MGFEKQGARIQDHLVYFETCKTLRKWCQEVQPLPRSKAFHLKVGRKESTEQKTGTLFKMPPSKQIYLEKPEANRDPEIV